MNDDLIIKNYIEKIGKSDNFTACCIEISSWAEKKKRHDIYTFLQTELNGYKPTDDIPIYRHGSLIQVKGRDMFGRWIPVELTKTLQKALNKITTLPDPLSMIETKVKNMKDTDNVIMQSPEINEFLGSLVKEANSFRLFINDDVFHVAFDGIKSELLSLLYKEIKSFPHEEKEDEEKVNENTLPSTITKSNVTVIYGNSNSKIKVKQKKSIIRSNIIVDVTKLIESSELEESLKKLLNNKSSSIIKCGLFWKKRITRLFIKYAPMLVSSVLGIINNI